MVAFEQHDAGCERPRCRPRCHRADDLAEHGPSFDARELVGVPDQHERRVRTHRVEQAGHQRERHHRRLVDHYEVMRQLVEAVVAGLPTDTDAQETMQRLGRGGAERSRDACAEARHSSLLVHRRCHARCRLAGRRAKRDVKLPAPGESQPVRGAEQRGDSARLAGARAAADNGDPAGQGFRDGFALKIGRRGAVGHEKLVEDHVQVG